MYCIVQCFGIHLCRAMIISEASATRENEPHQKSEKL